MCKISFIMPCYNTPQGFLEESINSVLNQTHTDIELIIVDDGSTDAVLNKLKEIARTDNRIKLLCNETNRGLAYTLNRALSQATGKYIFRMDSDDVCKTNRAQLTVDYLEKHPDVDIVGSQCVNLYSNNKTKKHSRQPETNDEIRASLLFSCPIVHPTVCFRKSSLEKKNIRYDNEKTEDYSFWVNCAINGCVFTNISEVLLYYRIHESQVTQKKDSFRESSTRIRQRLFNHFGIETEKDIFNEYSDFCFGRNTTTHSVNTGGTFLYNSIDSIPESYVSRPVLKKIAGKKFFHECLRLAIKGDTKIVKVFSECGLSRFIELRLIHSMVLLAVSYGTQVYYSIFSNAASNT